MSRDVAVMPWENYGNEPIYFDKVSDAVNFVCEMENIYEAYGVTYWLGQSGRRMHVYQRRNGYLELIHKGTNYDEDGVIIEGHVDMTMPKNG